MKRIGLMTCYVNNFGACLQAYALQKTIKSIGNECEIIRYSPYKQYGYLSPVDKAVNRVFDTLRTLRSHDYTYVAARNRRFEEFRRSYLQFGEAWFSSCQALREAPPIYDAYVVGSDQLWNPVIHGMKNNSAYFLDFVPDGHKRIAYAPSIGLYEIPKSCKSEMADYLNKFDVLSVREKAGGKIVTELTGRECPVVLDPTLLLSKERWEQIIPSRIVDEPYIFTYLFGNESYIGAFVHYAAEKTGLKVVTIPMHNRELKSNCIKIKDAGPLEFLSLLRNASLVITDSFHATAFAVNFNVAFYSLLRNTDADLNNMNSRIFNILEMTHLEQRLIENFEDFPRLISYNFDFNISNTALTQYREIAYKFLRESIL